MIEELRNRESRVPVKIWCRDIDPETRKQMLHASQLPFVFRWIALMPDAHKGIGCSIGSVIPTKKAIIPASVGVDIGCGMMAAKTNLRACDLPNSLKEIRHAIEREIPLGTGGEVRVRGGDGFDRRYPYGDYVAPRELEALVRDFGRIHGLDSKILQKSWPEQLGTLGSGNHFIELCLDEDQNLWVMLHSGSRGIGNMIGMHFIGKARREMERQDIRLPDRDLAYLSEGSESFNDYIDAVHWAQRYASINRRMMMAAILFNLRHHFPQVAVVENIINCHHNYVEEERHFNENVWVTRKGAIRAREGEFGIIPGSMGTKSYIVRGRGNPESFCSCSHGAGRRMSRTQAKKQFTVQDLEAQTEGVECAKERFVLDEIPSAYKDIDEVMENQKDLVDIVHTLKQVVCVKGG